MTDASPYADLPGYANLLLEESWVLDIAAQPGRLAIQAELVLTPDHPEYQPPGPQEQFCTRIGVLTFPSVVSLTWTGQGAPPATDATGSVDYGNIEVFTRSERITRVHGEFGSINVESDTPQVLLAPTRSTSGS